MVLSDISPFPQLQKKSTSQLTEYQSWHLSMQIINIDENGISEKENVSVLEGISVAI